MLMGTAEQVSAPTQETVFLEDLAPEQQMVAEFPPGIKNVGNTCYMNASLQCLFAVPELREAMTSFTIAGGDEHSRITNAARSLWTRLGEGKEAIEPLEFLAVFRQVYDRFAQLRVCIKLVSSKV
jgi:ubiquitin carboxyl-terminal hydrolase 14